MSTKLIMRGILFYFNKLYKNSIIRFDKLTKLLLCYGRLQLELSKVKDEIQFVHQTKKDVLTQKKFAMTEKKEAEKYLQIQKQYVCLTSITNLRNNL